MKITNIEIHNFRGIKTGNVSFPDDTRIVCLIGAGDSTKSTLLRAIEWVLWPTWNLTACDNDFYNCDTSTPIILRGTFSEIPEKLLGEDKFGLYLRRPGILIDPETDDEPIDGKPVCITIQLTIDGTLEPKWEVICNRKEPKLISHAERKLLTVGNIGTNCSKDMVWGKFSVLQKYADAKGILHDAHTATLRAVAENADLHELDEVAIILEGVGKQYGVGFQTEIRNRMIVQNSTFSSSVGLYDGKIPLNQRGNGSQRLLSMGLNIQASAGSAILLVDEIENGLEPYRLKSLINEFRTTHKTTGQVIMTTHSPIAVAECTVDEIVIIHSKVGETKAVQLRSTDHDTNAAMQAQMRSNPESFLCKRLIVCEGKTEQGFIRAVDTYLAENQNYRMAYKGVGVAAGGGEQTFDYARNLIKCGYEICIFMDSDKPNEKATKDSFRETGISIFDWEDGNCIEEQIFQDIPTSLAMEALEIAVDYRGIDSVKSKLTANDIPYQIEDEKIVLSEMDAITRKKIGTVAARSSKTAWFKRIDLGETLGDKVFSRWEEIDEESKLKTVVKALARWVTEHD